MQLSGLIDRSVNAGLEWLQRLSERGYSGAPLCRKPLAPESEYLRLWHAARGKQYPAVDAYEQACGAALDAEWFHHLGLVSQITIKRSPICYQHGRLLYATLVRYVRERSGRNLTVVETGTARGFSAVCMARALADTCASGKIITFDVLPHDAPIYWNCVLDSAGPRTRAQLLTDYADLIEPYVVFHRGNSRLELRKMAFPRVHFAFLDSVHTYDHVMAEFASIEGRQRPGDILFFDDYTPEAYPGVVKAADQISRTRGYAAAVVRATPQRAYLIAEKQ